MKSLKGRIEKFQNYESNYLDLPFENTLREYRKRKILETLSVFPHDVFLEIGCGPYPLFKDISYYKKMVIVEPGELFFKMAKIQANLNPKILVINDIIENLEEQLREIEFDFIVVGGFLHEIENPDVVLKSVKKCCNKNTIIYSFVPNAKSFHRLLALEMGLIDSIYQKSGHDRLFQRQNVYDIDIFNELMTHNGFNIIDFGSYFVKPFTHSQMFELLKLEIIDKSCLDGLEKMIKFLPNMGAELYNICKIND